MKIGDKVVFRKIGDNERTGRIIGINKGGKTVAVSTFLDVFIVDTASEDIVVIEENKDDRTKKVEQNEMSTRAWLVFEGKESDVRKLVSVIEAITESDAFSGAVEIVDRYEGK